MDVVILDETENDIVNAKKFYESQKVHLGDYFLTTILSDIESLHLFVGIHIKINGFNRLLSKRFPFAIYCKFSKSKIFIHAVLDCRKDPNNIRLRLL
ncbi:MAG: type II toxin-antitoxin system RelE/ParE family toxin [Gammaproteobacteria bacterium]|nr:MAG: type II toxin-antitoxin system RelE/ParE family toxin [Gammaproteobacteria bacterium]